MSPRPLLGPGDLRNQNQRQANADRAEVPVGWPPASYQPSQPQGAGADPSRRVSLPGEDFPPAGAIPVDVIGEADVSSVFVVGTSTIIATVTVPDTFRFRVAGIGFGADDESALRVLSWTLFVNPPAAPVHGYVNMPAAIGSIAYPAFVFIVLGSSVVLTVNVNNNSPVPVTYHYFVRVQGWFYSEKEGL